jgi:hypothetical protein
MKTRIHSLALLSTIILGITSASLPGAQAIYSSSGKATYFGAGKTQTINSKGFFIFDPDSHRAVAIGGSTINGQKVFTAVEVENHRVETVQAAKGASYMIIAKAESPGTQFAGILLESVYMRGLNAQVAIDSQGVRTLPRTFTGVGRSIGENQNASITVVGESTSNYTLDLKASRTSNQSETFDDAVARLTNYFVSRGYTEVTADPAE